MIRFTPSPPKHKNKTGSLFSHLVCSGCGTLYPKGEVHTVCRQASCQRSLIAAYDLGQGFDRDLLPFRSADMWRYAEVLPVENEANIVSLGEGMTPLLKARHLGAPYQLPFLFIKDESNNPTGSFKARGLCVAISKAKELGIKKCAIPTAGNAGGAMSAYAAKAGMEAHVFMPENTPEVFKAECRLFGATLTLIPGTILDCGQRVQEGQAREQWFNMSTLKEPYRVEGKKTMGYELAEQLGWELPDVILYPTGGGTGLIGLWKAFNEMEKLGWIGRKRPRLVAVQASGCAPLVHAFQAGESQATLVADAHTIANGLCVPKPYADVLLLQILRETGGWALAVTDAEIITALAEIARAEGLLVAPEGAALWAALKTLLAEGRVNREEKIVLLNTGSGYKYLENIPTAAGILQHQLTPSPINGSQDRDA
jgi:threonine synthase